MKKSNLLITLLVLLILPSAYALDIESSLEKAGTTLFNFFLNDYIVFGFMLVFFFILLYGVFAVGLSKIPSMNDSPHIKKIAAALSFLSTTAIFFFWMKKGIAETVSGILTPIGFFGGLALAFIVFSFFWYTMKDSEGKHNWSIAFIASGIAFIIFGQLTQSPSALSWGWVFLLIGLIGALIGAFGGGKSDSSDKGKDGDKDTDSDKERKKKRGELDNEHPGIVTVWVYDIDNTPVENARVTVGPESKSSKWFGWVGPRKSDFADGYTDSDGKFGPVRMGSGQIRIDVDASESQWPGEGLENSLKRGFKNIVQPWDRHKWRASRSEYLAPNEEKKVKIVLSREQPGAEGYEPYIISVERKRKEKTIKEVGKPERQEKIDVLELKGEIR